MEGLAASASILFTWPSVGAHSRYRPSLCPPTRLWEAVGTAWLLSRDGKEWQLSRPLPRRVRPQGLIPWGTDDLRGSRHLPNTPSFTPPPCPPFMMSKLRLTMLAIQAQGHSACAKQGWDSYPTEPAWEELRPIPARHSPTGPSLQDSRLEPKQSPYCMALVPRAERKEPTDAAVTAHLYLGLHPLLALTSWPHPNPAGRRSIRLPCLQMKKLRW